jgi:hypothetical protein
VQAQKEEKQSRQAGLQAQQKAKMRHEKATAERNDSDDDEFNSTGGSYKGIKLESSGGQLHAIADELPEVAGPIIFKKRKIGKKKKAGMRKKSRADDD